MADRGKCVIFMDVDGVIVPVSPMSFGGGDIDSTCLDKLKQIIALCGGPDAVTIVLSSTWRHDEGKKVRLNKAFDGVGGIPQTSLGVPDGTKHPPTVVTYLKKDPQEQKLVRDRVDEIYEWIADHADTFPEAAAGKRWFAIDDMNLGVDERMKGHFVKSDTEDGLQSSDVKAADAVISALPEFVTTACRVDEPEASKPAAHPAELPSAVLAEVSPSRLHPNVQAFAPQPRDRPSSATVPLSTADPISTMAPGEPLLYHVDYIGVVKRYNPNRGFGFLTAPNGEDVFLHQSMILHQGFRAVNVGETVSFQIIDEPVPGSTSGATRRQAVHVRQLSPYIPTNIQRQMMSQWELYQPYVPGAASGFYDHGGPQGKKTGVQKGVVVGDNEGDGQESSTAELTVELKRRPQPFGGSEYHGPGTRGRGMAYTDLPLIPDGYGYRAVNGTVFFPVAEQGQLQVGVGETAKAAPPSKAKDSYIDVNAKPPAAAQEKATTSRRRMGGKK